MKKLFSLLFCLTFLFSVTFIYLNATSPTTNDDVSISVKAYFDNENKNISQDSISLKYAQNRVISLEDDIEGANGYTFAYWIVNGFVRTDLSQNHSFIAVQGLEIVAVFVPNGYKVVVFADANNSVLKIDGLYQVNYVQNGGNANPPSTVGYSKPGYTIPVENPWSVSLLNINANAIAKINYVVGNSNTYTLSVENGTGAGTYNFNEVVAVSADAAPLNQVFVYWQEDGSILSYNPNIEITILKNRSLVAVYSATPIEKQNLIHVSQPLALRTGYLSFVGKLEKIDNFQIVEYGLIASTGSTEITLNSSNITKYRSENLTVDTNEFLITVQKRFYAIRGYYILRNLENELEIVYSSMVYFSGGNSMELDFESSTKGNYDTADITIQGNSWKFTDVLIGTSGDDRKIDSKALRMREGSIQSNFAFEFGIQSIHMLLAKYGTDANSIVKVQYAYEWNPTSWLTVQDGESDLEINVTSATLTPVQVELNIKGSVYIRIVKSETTRVNIDHLIINIGNYSDSVLPVISGPSSTSITQGDTFNPLYGVTALDNFDGVLTGEIVVLTYNASQQLIESPGDYSALSTGVYTIVYKVEDSSNNLREVSITLTINAAEPQYTLFRHYDFGTTAVTGYAAGTVTFTNSNNSTSYILTKDRAQINISATAPHTSMGAFLVLAPISTAKTSFVEFDFTSITGITRITFAVSSWSASAVTNAAALSDTKQFSLQYYDTSTSTWVTLSDVSSKSNLFSSIVSSSYTEFTFNTTLSAKFRLYYYLEGASSTSNTQYAFTVDNLKVYK